MIEVASGEGQVGDECLCREMERKVMGFPH